MFYETLLRQINLIKRKTLYRGVPVSIPERSIEYSFVFMNIGLPPAVVLDVGCSGSDLPAALAAHGFDVYGMDIMAYHIKNPTFKFVKGDFRRTSFPGRFFDIVTAVSTIEHVGLSGRYGVSEEDPLGDRHAMDEIKRILKTNGKIILTVPYGRPMTLRPWCRVYGEKSLEELVKDFSIMKEEYFIKNPNGCWAPAPEVETSKVVPYVKVRSGIVIDHLYALACLVLINPE